MRANRTPVTAGVLLAVSLLVIGCASAGGAALAPVQRDSAGFGGGAS